jgi:peptidoglycan/LPS O-acetylase OafA/YrhL
MHQTHAKILAGSKSNYSPPLDALRFFAFLAVFIHHFPVPTASTVAVTVKNYGWGGVDLFFVISSYLLFRLLDGEYEKAGTISARNFYIRRLMRIYPLMVGFPILMLLVYGAQDWTAAVARLVGLALFADNFLSWVDGYNKAIPFSPHLWTLSFELQVYLLIPAAFMAWKRMGKRKFLLLLGAVLVAAIALRSTFSIVGAKHPVVWVTPFLRPDSVIMGLALAAAKPRWHWSWSALIAAIGLTLFISMRMPWAGPWYGAASYLVLAIAAAGTVDVALRSPFANMVTKDSWLVYLGKISFGLYVYHLVAISVARRWLHAYWGPLDPKEISADSLLLFGAALALTIAFAAVSYHLVERRVEKAKQRFTVVPGRPV